MLNRLRFELTPRPHPYSKEPTSLSQLWGQLTIAVVTDQGTQILYQTEWDLAELAEWFTEHQITICSDYLVDAHNELVCLPGESLAQALVRLQHYDFTDEDIEFEWFTKIFEFRRRHTLTFGLRGSRIPPITIGCNSGSGEISLVDETTTWSYHFDMTEFLNDLQDRIRTVVAVWSKETQEEAHKRAIKILAGLNEVHHNCCSSPDDILNV
jgi:hypothetical protein